MKLLRLDFDIIGCSRCRDAKLGQSGVSKLC